MIGGMAGAAEEDGEPVAMRLVSEVFFGDGGVALEPTPLRVVVEELAHAILAERRARRPMPPSLALFAHLFGPDLEESAEAGVPACP